MKNSKRKALLKRIEEWKESERSGGFKPRYSDEEMVKIVEDLGLCTISDLHERTGYSRTYICYRMLHLIPKVKKFIMRAYGRGFSRARKHGGSVLDLLDGFAMVVRSNKDWVFYYVDEKVAAKRIIEQLKLTPELSRHHRGRLTSVFRKSLTPSLFKLVYEAYRSKRKKDER